MSDQNRLSKSTGNRPVLLPDSRISIFLIIFVMKKIHSMKKILLIAVLITSSFAMKAQENPWRVGLKLGVPTGLCFNGEYVTPWVGGKLAFFADLGYLPVKGGDVLAKATIIGTGALYYFKEDGLGWYAGIGVNNLILDITLSDQTKDLGNGIKLTGGEGNTKFSVNTAYLKFGGRFGEKWYFRPEIGYGLQFAPDEIFWPITYTSPIPSTEVRIDEMPDILNYGIVFNLGFGVSF